MSKTCIIIGASHAAAQLIASLRQEGWEDDILTIGDEPHLPYHRPPLSKAYLAGDKSAEELAIRPASFYEKQSVGFYQGRVTRINPDGKSVSLEDGQELAYDKLAICTGARVRKIQLPGSDLSGIHYLRDMSDVQGIKRDMGAGKSAVIIGGGYIGLETAASLREQGMNVVVLEMAERILQRVTPPELSEFYTRVHTEHGVSIQTSVSVSRFKGNGHVEKVICDDGQTFDADLVVVGIGVLPNVELAQEAGIEVDNGIVIDESCNTSAPDIVAVGDCTNHFDKTYDCRLRLESVPNANEQAKVAAATLCGKKKIYHSLPWFWSDQYDLKLQIAGLSTNFTHIVIRGDKDTGHSFAAFYFKDDNLIAADCVNRPQEFMLMKKILGAGQSIKAEYLADEGKSVKELMQLAG